MALADVVLLFVFGFLGPWGSLQPPGSATAAQKYEVTLMRRASLVLTATLAVLLFWLFVGCAGGEDAGDDKQRNASVGGTN